MTITEVQQTHRHTDIGPDYRQTTVAVDGGRMTVGLWGPTDPGAPTVLAVHGVSASHRSFGLLAEQLEGIRVIAPDLRGRGRSNQLPGPYGMPVHADDLATVLAHLAAGPVVVVGHSMGAFVTEVLAHRHPSMVSSVVLIDGGIPLRVPAGLSPDQMVQAVLGPVAERLAMSFGSVADYRAFWLEHPALGSAWAPEPDETGGRDRPAEPGGPGEPANRSGLRQLMEDYIAYDLEPGDGALHPATRYEAMAQDTAELQAGGTLLAALEALKVPTTLLWSRRGLFNEEPGLFSPGYIAEWQNRLPALKSHLNCTEIPDSNHYTILMAPAGAAAVAETVLQHLVRRCP